MNYTLIKTEDNYILVSDERYESHNWVYKKSFTGDMIYHTSEELKAAPPVAYYHNKWQKIIASLNKIEGVPKLIFADVVSEQIGVSFVKKYTVDEMMQCFEESRLTHPMVGFKHDTFEDFISNTNKTSWNVEIEIEHYSLPEEGYSAVHKHNRPKVTNNTIKALSIVP